MTHINSPKMTDDQQQIILGTLLGGSSILKAKSSKNSYLSMRHKNKTWLKCKAEELAIFANDHPYSYAMTNRWRSNAYPIFNEYRKLFYINSYKQVDISVLDKLKDIGLAVWYGDCGGFDKYPYFKIKHSFEVTCTYFNLLDFEPYAIKGRVYIKQSSKFFKIIGPCLPKFMFTYFKIN